MPAFLLKLLVANPIALLWIAGGILLAGVAAGAGGVWMLQGWRLDTARARLDACQQQVAVLGQKVAEQNDAVQQWQDSAKKARQDARGATIRARQVAESHAGLVAVLDAKLKAPQPGSGPIQILGCADALLELRAVIR